MTRTAATSTFLAEPREGRALSSLRRAAPASEDRSRRPGRWAGFAEVATGAALLALWALLWSVFVAGVVTPAGGLSRHGRDQAPRPSGFVERRGIDTGRAAP